MNRNHLDNVVFKKKVKLKEPVYQEKEVQDPNRNVRIFFKVMRLIFFFIVVAALCYGTYYFVGSCVSFSRGEEYKSPAEHYEIMKKDYR